MRKTDDRIILQMKAEGKGLKEIASFFGVSSVAVWKRLKRLTPVKEPESFAKLTDKQKLFVLGKISGKSNTGAAMSAFGVSTKESAKALGHNLMRDPDITKAIQDIMFEEGLSRRHLVRKLKELVNHSDANISVKGVSMATKIMDLYPKREEIPAPQIVIKPERLEALFKAVVEYKGEGEAKRIFSPLFKSDEEKEEG